MTPPSTDHTSSTLKECLINVLAAFSLGLIRRDGKTADKNLHSKRKPVELEGKDE